MNPRAVGISIATIVLFALMAIHALAAGPPVTPIPSGGLGTSTAPAYGKLLVGGAHGEYEFTGTTTLGLTTTNVAEGSNLYFTTGRAQAAISASYPLLYANGVVSAAYGTTTANSWGALQVFGNASTSALTVTGSAWLGTILSGTWNGSTIGPTFGGTGISNPTAAGVLVGSYPGGGWQQVATSSLGLSTTNVAEGLNLYWTNARFDTRLSATTSLPNITTLSGLSLPLSQTTGTLGVNQGGTASTTLGGILAGSGTGAVKSAAVGTGLSWDGTTLANSGVTSNAGDWAGSWQTFAPSHFQTALGFTPVPSTRNVTTTYPLQGGGTLSGDLTLTTAFSTTTTNAFNKLNTFANATSTLFSAGTIWDTDTPNAVLSTDQNGKLVATSTIGVNLLSASTIGATSPNGTLTFGTAATLGNTFTGDLNLANPNTWTGLQTLGGGFLSTASSTVTGTLTLATTTTGSLNGTINVTGWPYAQTGAGLQTALNVCASINGRVHLPAGTYTLSTLPTFPSNCEVFGDGASSTIIVLNTSSGALTNSNTANGNTNINLHDFNVIGNSSSKSNVNEDSCFQIYGVLNFYIDRVYINDCKADGIDFRAATSNSQLSSGYVGYVPIKNVGRNGISMEGGNGITIQSTPISNIGVFGIDLEAGTNENIQINWPDVSDFYASGIQVTEPSGAYTTKNISINYPNIHDSKTNQSTGTVYGLYIKANTGNTFDNIHINGVSVTNINPVSIPGIGILIGNGSLITNISTRAGNFVSHVLGTCVDLSVAGIKYSGGSIQDCSQNALNIDVPDVQVSDLRISSSTIGVTASAANRTHLDNVDISTSVTGVNFTSGTRDSIYSNSVLSNISGTPIEQTSGATANNLYFVTKLNTAANLSGFDGASTVIGDFSTSTPGLISITGGLSVSSSTDNYIGSLQSSPGDATLYVYRTSGEGTPPTTSGTVAQFGSNAGAPFTASVSIIGGSAGFSVLGFGNKNVDEAGQIIWNNSKNIFNITGGNFGIATATPGSLFSINGIANFTTATSTLYGTGGINLSNGCFAVLNSCLSLSNLGGTVSLTSQVSNILPIANGGTATSTLGVANGLVYNNGANWTNGSSLIWNGTQLGVNTANPNSTLDVNGIGFVRGTNSNSAPTPLAGFELFTGRDSTGALNGGQTAGDVAFDFGGGGGGYRHWIVTKHSAGANTGNAIEFFINTGSSGGASSAPGTNNVRVLGLYGNGDVGLGTTNPGSKLEVQGIATAQSFNATSTATSTFTGGISANVLNITSSSASSTFANGIQLSGGCVSVNGTCLTSNLGTVTSITTTYPITGGTFTTAGTIALAFGTSTANTWASTQTFGTIQGNDVINMRRNDPNNYISFFPQGGSGGREWWVGSTRSSASLAPQGDFFIFDNTAGGTARLVIDSSGNMGIATTTPAAKLDVNDSKIIVETAHTPASSSEACVAGTIEWDASFVYVCTSVNTWKRSTLSSF